MAQWSDSLLIGTILAYAVAMLAYGVEYSFGRRGPLQRRTSAPAELATVGAGAPTAAATHLPEAPVSPVVGGPGKDGSPVPALAGRLAVALTVLGLVLHTGVLVTRGVAAGRVPWGNMFEYAVAVCLIAVTAWTVVLLRQRQVRPLGAFVMLPVVLLLGLAGTVLYTQVGPLVPALNSYWLKIHVTAAIIATGTFMISFATGVLYLVRDLHDRRVLAGRPLHFPASVGARLPAAEVLERATFRVIAFAFPIWTFAIMAGAIWAEAAWSRYWGWDPKETWSFITWVFYAAYLHARATAGWKGRKAVWIAVAAFAAMLVNLFGVNLVISGLHSYAGLQ